MKVAVVHDCLAVMGGAESVLKEILALFPKADLYSLVDFLEEDGRKIKKGKTSFIQKLPRAKKNYRFYFPLMPMAVEDFDLSSYDLILSSSYAMAKGVITHPQQLHICYCHSPMRYCWDLQNLYLKDMRCERGPQAALAKYIFHKMRLWDVSSSFRVDSFIANSRFIQSRIRKYYRRDSQVIYPPVDIDRFSCIQKKEDFYLTCSRLVPYKRVDLIVAAFAKMGDKKLIVIGDGPEFSKLQKVATSNVTLLGRVDEGQLKEYMEKAKGFVFAAKEDFGISPIEAQAAGTPVIAYGQGGVLETIKGLDDKAPTGCFFYEQAPESIVEAVNLFEANISRIKIDACRKNSERFSAQKFRKEFFLFVEKEYQNFQKGDYEEESAPPRRRKRSETMASF